MGRLTKLVQTEVFSAFRGATWQAFMGLTQPWYGIDDRQRHVANKRAEYAKLTRKLFLPFPQNESLGFQMRANMDDKVPGLKVIKEDIGRTGYEIFNLPRLQRRLYRVLVTFSHNHPTIGYHQGFNFEAATYILAYLDSFMPAVSGPRE